MDEFPQKLVRLNRGCCGTLPLLRDREQCKTELRTRHLGLGVLVPPFEAWQSRHSHHQHPLSGLDHHNWRLRWDFHLDTEAIFQNIDGCFVAGVQTGHHTSADDLLCLLHEKGFFPNGAGLWEHRRGNTESKVSFHMIFFLLLCVNVAKHTVLLFRFNATFLVIS